MSASPPARRLAVARRRPGRPGGRRDRHYLRLHVLGDQGGRPSEPHLPVRRGGPPRPPGGGRGRGADRGARPGPALLHRPDGGGRLLHGGALRRGPVAPAVDVRLALRRRGVRRHALHRRAAVGRRRHRRAPVRSRLGRPVDRRARVRDRRAGGPGGSRRAARTRPICRRSSARRRPRAPEQLPFQAGDRRTPAGGRLSSWTRRIWRPSGFAWCSISSRRAFSSGAKPCDAHILAITPNRLEELLGDWLRDRPGAREGDGPPRAS